MDHIIMLYLAVSLYPGLRRLRVSDPMMLHIRLCSASQSFCARGAAAGASVAGTSQQRYRITFWDLRFGRLGDRCTGRALSTLLRR